MVDRYLLAEITTVDEDLGEMAYRWLTGFE